MEKKTCKKKAIYQDHRIAEEFCNFRCDYCEGFCPSGYSLSTDKEGNLVVPDEWYRKMETYPEEVQKYFKDGRKMQNFYKIAYDVMEKTKEIIDTDILKISGGEVTTNVNLLEFVKKIHKSYPVVQILTNGLNLTEYEINEYKKLGNICFQISLDGVTGETNYARTHSEIITEKVLKNIDCILKEGMGIEINCVLTKYNTDKFGLFLERFKDADNFIVVPRPVRGEPKKILTFSNEQIIQFKNLLYSNYDKYSKILPPMEYVKRLIKTMENGTRTTNCYVPFFVQSIDGYGNFEECPCGIISENTHNILNSTVVKDELLENSKYTVKNNYDSCKYCMTQYEMINLYVDGKIAREELMKVPSLSINRIIDHIDEVKDKLIITEIKKKLEERYSLVIEKIEKSDESTNGNVYIVHSNNEKYVVRLYDNVGHTNSMVSLYNELIHAGLNVSKIIMNKENKNYEILFNSYYLVVYSYLEGNQIGWDSQYRKLNKELISEIAIELRNFHNATCKENVFNLPNLPFEDNDCIERKCVVHFDLTRNNILINQKNNKVGIIDFDDAKYGSAIYDIAIIVANLFFSKTYGVDINGAKIFIDEYYLNDIELKKNEIKSIKKYAIKWIDYILDGNKFDTSTTESFIIRKQLIEENLNI